jgi:hypothetical protein
VFDSNDKQSRRLYQILAVAPTTWAMVDVIDESLMFCFLDLKKKIFLEQAKFSFGFQILFWFCILKIF